MSLKTISKTGTFKFAVILMATLIVFTFMWGLYISITETRIIRKGIKVEAELIKYTIYDSSPSGRSEWMMVYYYKDEKGIEYRGYTLSFTATEEDVKNRIGNKIYIYIDGEGNSTSSTNMMSPWLAGFILFSFVALDGYLIWRFYIKPKKDKQ